MKRFVPTARKAALSLDLVPTDVTGGLSVIVKKGNNNTETILNTAEEVYGIKLLNYEISPSICVYNIFQSLFLFFKVKAALKGNNVSTIVCAAGSWAGGSVATREGLDSIDRYS